MKEFARGTDAVRSLRNGRLTGRASIDIAEIWRRANGNPRSREPTRRRISVRIANEWRGGDLLKMIRDESPHVARNLENWKMGGNKCE